MVEMIKLLILAVGTLMETMPQSDGTTKIEDGEYSTIIANGVLAIVKGSGYMPIGFLDDQVIGAVKYLVPVVSSYRAAVRVSV